MYIRTVNTKSKGITYRKQRLVESYRTAEGKVRQRVIMDLGNIEEEIPKTQWKELATLLELRLNGQMTFISYSKELEKQADLLYSKSVYSKSKNEIKEQTEQNKDFETIDLNSIQVSEARQLGPEIVAKSIWDELEFEQLLKSCEFSDNEISVAMALIIGRFICPGSEMETYRWFQNRTSLIEMTPNDISDIGKDIFYKTGDLLYKKKDKIESYLYDRETTIFSLERKIFLFDLTNTYFEGSAIANELAHYGRSKEKRTDCPLVSMALMVDGEGFPVYSRVYEGNVSEPKTLQEVIEDINNNIDNYTKKPIFIMDKGIATAENIEYLKESGYDYVLIERANKASDYEEEFYKLKEVLDKNPVDCEKLGWETTDKDSEVYVKEVKVEEKDGSLLSKKVLTLSLNREKKELAMNEAKVNRFKGEIGKIQNSIESGRLKLTEKVNIRLGRLLEKYKGIKSFFEISVESLPDDDTIVKSINIKDAEGKPSKSTLSGTYVIETNQTHLSKIEIWKMYTMLTKVEAAFRDLKSELGLRPIFHRNEERTKAHLFIGMLAYHFLIAVEYRLSSNNDNRSWRTIRNELSTHQRATVNFVNQNGRRVNLRVSTTPETQHLDIYNKLNVSNPLKRIKSIY